MLGVLHREKYFSFIFRIGLVVSLTHCAPSGGLTFLSKSRMPLRSISRSIHVGNGGEYQGMV
jgi:hypothetical protein